MTLSIWATIWLATASAEPSTNTEDQAPPSQSLLGPSDSGPRNIVSLNPLTIFLYGIYGFEWERWLIPHLSVYAEPAFVSATPNGGRSQVMLYSAAIGARWYPLSVGARGLFTGLQIFGGRGTRTDTDDFGTAQHTTALAISAGAQVGYTLLFADELQLSAGLGGSVGFDNVWSDDSAVALRVAPLLRATVGFAF